MGLSNPGGTVETLASPGDKYFAWVGTYSQIYFWGGQRDYYEFYVLPREVHTGDPNFPWRYQPNHIVVCDRMAWIPFPSRGEGGWCDIKWMADSSVVTYDLHSVSVYLPTPDL